MGIASRIKLPLAVAATVISVLLTHLGVHAAGDDDDSARAADDDDSACAADAPSDSPLEIGPNAEFVHGINNLYWPRGLDNDRLVHPLSYAFGTASLCGERAGALQKAAQETAGVRTGFAIATGLSAAGFTALGAAGQEFSATQPDADDNGQPDGPSDRERYLHRITAVGAFVTSTLATFTTVLAAEQREAAHLRRLGQIMEAVQNFKADWNSTVLQYHAWCPSAKGASTEAMPSGALLGVLKSPKPFEKKEKEGFGCHDIAIVDLIDIQNPRWVRKKKYEVFNILNNDRCLLSDSDQERLQVTLVGTIDVLADACLASYDAIRRRDPPRAKRPKAK